MSAARRRPSQQRSRETVEWIVEAAARVFEREGLDATTNRIAEEAGVSIGSLYQYFPDKHALLDELAIRHLEEGEAALESSWSWVGDPSDVDLRESLAKLVAEIAALHDRRGGLHQVMRAHAGRSVEVAGRFARLIESLVDRVATVLLAKGIDDPYGRARLIVATVDAQVHGVLAGGEPDRRVERIRIVVNQVLAVVDG